MHRQMERAAARSAFCSVVASVLLDASCLCAGRLRQISVVVAVKLHSAAALLALLL